MPRPRYRSAANYFFLLLLLSLVANFTWAQSETATVSGQVVDPSGLKVTAAQVKLVDIDRETTTLAITNNSGFYTFPSVRPGRYRMEVTVAGFKVVNVTGLTVNVQDHLEQNLQLAIGSVSESVTVEAGSPLVDTESAAVSTVVDRQFAENLPLNGRSFQTLIQLTPGVVVTPSTYDASGQFSVNGQRASSNYWTVDGVSANIGASTYSFTGNGPAGAVPGASVLGGTNSLVSVDALQEFRIQTSTYAPEFGRTPGAQISIVTRSGTNQFHGSGFDYLRNDVLDASNWFNGYINTPPLPKAEERQNDFGGTLSGPIIPNRTFFFFSYEGLRLRLPQTQETTVPDLAARESAIAPVQPLLNAFPSPNGPDLGNGIAEFNKSYSNAATLDAASLRIDHKIGEKLSVFGRYNYSPSELLLRGNSGQPLSISSPSAITTQTATFGGAWSISSTVLDDFRFNYSRSSAASRSLVDTFGGAAVPSIAALLPRPFTTQNSQFLFYISSLTNGALTMGNSAQNQQKQLNVVNTFSWQHSSHAVKAGVDYRRLPFHYGPLAYFQEPFFADVPSAVAGTPLVFSYVLASQPATLVFQNLGIFAQDTWRLSSRLTMTYGLRWDVDFAPSSSSGPALSAVTNFNDPSQLGLAAQGTPPFATKYGNVAPRLGLAYQISQRSQWETVVRGGVGLFYDLATQEVGNLIAQEYPFFATKFGSGGSFPLDVMAAAPPPFAPPSSTNPVTIAGFDPKLTLPYTLQWNASIDQSLGKQQVIGISYVGAAGRRLIQTENLVNPNPNIAGAVLVSNAGVSDYDAMQIQFNRRLSRGLQALLSYTWAHSIDTGSASSGASSSNLFNPEVGANANRGPSDFDIRNAFSAGLTYQIPAPLTDHLLSAILRGWSMHSVIQARSSPPVNVFNSSLTATTGFGPYTGNIRPDLVSGIPLYLDGAEYPGGKSINNTPNQGGAGCIGPFCPPPTNPNGVPLRQGDLSRNALRGFGASQWDLAIHRDFPIRESLSLQVRAEMFNVLNHPNFGQPNGDLSNAFFGRSTQMLGQSLDQIPGGGSLSALYQIGGPRSIQLALRFGF